MRELLFRGKQAYNDKWAFSEYPFGTIHCGAVVHDFIPETVGQYTGLTDKNGNRIFEGDICQTKGFPLIDDKPFVVEWNDDECSFYRRDVLGTDEFNIGVSQNTTIIGNIHDIPEFLKGE